MRTLGVDLASADRTTAACMVEWDDGPPRVGALFERDVTDSRIVELARGAGVTGIDAPFGWPMPFVEAVAAYAAGAPWPRHRPAGLWLRRTDHRAQRTSGGRAPLSVSSDRIARPAERAARLLTLLGTEGRAVRRDGSDGVIEVYPAGAMRCWDISVDRYKRPDGTDARDRIITAIVDALDLRLSPSDRAAFVRSDHALDALVAALLGRAFHVGLVVRPTADEQRTAAIEGWLYLPTGVLTELR